MIDQLLECVRSPDRARAADVRAHLDQLTKPRGSLGRLELLALRVARIYGDPPPALSRRAVFVLCADHGVARQGVSAYPSSVTEQMCRVLADGRAGINALARATGVGVIAIDIGVDTDGHTGNRAVGHLGTAGHQFYERRVRRGTRDLSIEAALLPSEVEDAVRVGYEEAIGRLGALDIVGIGELGIGNTTSAAALTAALLGVDEGRVVGRGTGVDAVGLERKRTLIRRALARFPSDARPLAVLAEVGGLEIAGLVGVILAACSVQKAVVLDGFVATAAALVAVTLQPAVRGYLIASHRSPEPGHRVQLRALGLRPLFDLGMRLGEGTGAALAFPMIDAAGSLLREMATFADAGIAPVAAT
jgi:nicotinate-nucleotide--dimethylbenzimidazole phosphoribosyltransferase